MEEMLDAYADRVSKPRLYITDKMQIALGTLVYISILSVLGCWCLPFPSQSCFLKTFWCVQTLCSIHKSFLKENVPAVFVHLLD